MLRWQYVRAKFVRCGDVHTGCRFHFFLIFPSREWHMAEISFTMPGAGLWLKSVWIAMCVELYFRELIFLVRLKQERWMRNI